MNQRDPKSLRSQRWLGQGPYSFAHRSRTMQNGITTADFSGKPVIAIVNTWSELNTCHSHLRDVAEVVKRGVWEAGGYPVEVPAMSLGEIMMKPTAMLYRNLLAMETEELLRCHPVDGAVLLGGCDKTTPGLLMGAISMDLPCVYVPSGFMLHGLWRGEHLGSGVDGWKYSDELRTGRISIQDWAEIEAGSARTAGTCNTMGTASTMTAIAESLGLTLPMASSVAAVDAMQRRLANEAGRRAVAMVWDDLRPSRLLNEASVRNAATINFALGGSTNAAIHLIAIARRAGVSIDLKWLDAIAQQTPVLVDILPSGRFLLEDFYEAGGLPALMNVLRDRLDLSRPTVTGKTLGENIEGARVFNPEVIRSLDNPKADCGFAALFGNLAPGGCVIKASAASPELLKHKGRAVVFESRADLEARIDDPDLDVDENSVLVMREGGPQGAPGMPEWGRMPIPRKLLQKGVHDMVRISDARMSGTSYGTILLHVTPESHLGGPLALVKDGDEIEIDVSARRISLHVSDEELDRRRDAWQQPPARYQRGYGAIFLKHVLPASDGCDFDFLLKGEPTPDPDLFL
jgi:dihydroxy-acid dehydratase